MKNLIKIYDDLLSEAIDSFGNVDLDEKRISTLAAKAMDVGFKLIGSRWKELIPLIIAGQYDEASAVIDSYAEKALYLFIQCHSDEIKQLPETYKVERRSDLSKMLCQAILNGTIYAFEVKTARVERRADAKV